MNKSCVIRLKVKNSCELRKVHRVVDVRPLSAPRLRSGNIFQKPYLPDEPTVDINMQDRLPTSTYNLFAKMALRVT